MRTPRLAAGITTLALLFAPAVAASAQEPTTTESAEATETTEEAELATPSSILATLLDMLAEAMAPAVEADADADADAEVVVVVVVEGEVDVVEEEATEDEVVSVVDTLREAIKTFITTVTIELEVTAALAEVEAEDAEDVDAVDGSEDSEGSVDGESKGQIVRTVAHCAPNGQVAKGLIPGVKNHGALVSLAAHGATVAVSGADPDSGELVSESFDLSTMEGAEAFCSLLDLVVAADAATADEDDAKNKGQAKKADRNTVDEDTDEEAAEEEAAPKSKGRSADKGSKGKGKKA